VCRRRTGHPFDFAHGSSAAWAQVFTLGSRARLRPRVESRIQEELEPLQAGFAAGVEESAVADAVEPFRQSVLKESSDKLDAVEDPGFVGFGITVFDTDANLVAFDSENTVVRDNAAADILAEILDGVLSASGPVDRSVPIGFDQLPEQG